MNTFVHLNWPFRNSKLIGYLDDNVVVNCIDVYPCYVIENKVSTLKLPDFVFTYESGYND